MATAMLRALAAHDEREEIRGPDHLAEIFLTEDRRSLLSDPAKRKWVLQNKITPGAYEFMLARTAYFDHVVRQALLSNLSQVVFLGAGYDTRPYRFRDLVRDTRIFELDAAPTQLRKREILEQTATPLPDTLKFLPIDLSRDDLRSVLLAADFSMEAPALFIWEGVMYYLTAEAVDATLAAVRSLSAAGSSICFDYGSLSPGTLSEDRGRKLREHLRSNHPGEPVKFGIPSGSLEAFLNERGYTLVECLSSTEMESRYLTLRDGSVLGKVAPLFAFAHAAVE
jgi:methyltransferase (TIGR00027 family)